LLLLLLTSERSNQSRHDSGQLRCGLLLLL
jgi:hypothetical protein